MTDDITAEVIKQTQNSLGKFVQKPLLTEKLLKKPPFRFLHDIVTAVIRDTGFFSGLFSDREMISEYIKDRDMKIAFLQKLISCVVIVTDKKLTVRPSKIIAGLEPTKTNELLQAIGYALNKKLDSSAAVSQITGEKQPKIKIKAKDDKKSSHKTRENTDNKSKSSNNSTPRTKQSNQTKLLKKTSEESTSKKTKDDKHTKVEKTRDHRRKDKISPRLAKSKELVTKKVEPEVETPKTSTKEVEETPKELDTSLKEVIETVSPSTTEIQNLNETDEALGKPEGSNINLKESVEVKTNKDESVEVKTNKDESVASNRNKEEVKDVAPKEFINKGNEPIVKPKTSLRPPSVRPTSSRPGAPRFKNKNDLFLPPDELVPMGEVSIIVENFSNQEDTEETVVVEVPQELSFPEPFPQTKPELPAEKGHLVTQILEQLETVEAQEQNLTRRVEIEWESSDGKRNREAASRDVEKLRDLIQTLTRAANPLGKLMNFLHEDVDSMRSELKMWIEVNEKLSTEINNQERLNEESIVPLKSQLKDLQEDVEKQQNQIYVTQANILRNEQKITMLLTRN